MNKGKIIQIVGSVIDAEFPQGAIPPLLNALEVKNDGKTTVFETSQHLGSSRVRDCAWDDGRAGARNGDY